MAALYVIERHLFYEIRNSYHRCWKSEMKNVPLVTTCIPWRVFYYRYSTRVSMSDCAWPSAVSSVSHATHPGNGKSSFHAGKPAKNNRR